MTDFGNHACARHRFLNHFGDPAAAADGCRRALDANLFAAAGIAGIANAFLNDCPWDLTSFRDPFTAALIDGAAFGDRLEGGVADILPASLRFRLPAGGADIAVAGLVHGFADGVANCSVAGLIHRLANGVADIAIAGLVHGFANSAGDVAVAGLIDRFADGVALRAIAGLVHWLADSVAFVSIAGFVDVFHTADRTCFGAVVVDGLHAVVLLGFPNNVLLDTAPCGYAAAGCDEISAG